MSERAWGLNCAANGVAVGRLLNRAGGGAACPGLVLGAVVGWG
jgi:hypothetical protein